MTTVGRQSIDVAVDTAKAHGVTRVDPVLATRTRMLVPTLMVTADELAAVLAAVAKSNQNLGDWCRDAVLSRLPST